MTWAERLARADRAAMAAVPAWRTPSGVAAARAVSALAEPAFTGPVLAAAAVIAARRGGWRAAVLRALAVPAGVAARWLLSEMIARPRPPAAIWLAEPEGYSLPSRHTTIATLTAGAVGAAAGTKGLRRRAIPFLAAVGVGASRVLQLTGEGGLLGRLAKLVIEGALEGEPGDHLGDEKNDLSGRNGGNSRNGHRAKTVLTEPGRWRSACRGTGIPASRRKWWPNGSGG
jgi:hypothetical protein